MAQIPGDRLVLATISVLRTLVLELSRKGLIEVGELVGPIQETAASHRGSGDPNNLADAIDAIAEHFLTSVSEQQVDQGHH